MRRKKKGEHEISALDEAISPTPLYVCAEEEDDTIFKNGREGTSVCGGG